MIEQFKDNLIAGIQTAPVLFIPHYHFTYIDEIIESILSPKEIKYFNLNMDSILEYSLANGPINFKTKKAISDSFSDGLSGYIKEIITPKPAPEDATVKDRRIVKDVHQIFLFKITQMTSKIQRIKKPPVHNKTIAKTMPRTFSLPQDLNNLIKFP